jgi:aryl-alcohol dehydrogenase-like predicted oxidoreductase
MDYVKFGKTGLGVSRLCIGCMTYGIPGRGPHPWTLDEEKSRPLIKQALELGINFFDTANVYSDGTSEEIVGRALKEFTRREDVVIATKVHGRFVRVRTGRDCRARRSLANWITACAVSAPTSSISIRFIAGIRRSRSRRRWKRSTTS